VLAEKVGDYFELSGESPYMLLVAPVKAERRVPFDRGQGEDMLAVVRQPRSDLPAVTHVDYSARIQTVHPDDNPRYHEVLSAFERATGYGTIVNTSFNVRGEPIVCTPYDAYRCFMRTNMDALVMENFLLLKEEQPPWPEGKGHVENDDAPGAMPAPEDSLAGDLSRLFDEALLPLSRASNDINSSRQQSRDGATFWRTYTGPVDPREVFPIPPVLDRGAENAFREQALVITGGFSSSASSSSGAALPREELVALVTRLLELGARHRGDEELEEEVPQSIYVMF
jgi:carbamoyltransferase